MKARARRASMITFFAILYRMPRNWPATFKLEKIEDKERFVSGFVLHDGTVGEMVVSVTMTALS